MGNYYLNISRNLSHRLNLINFIPTIDIDAAWAYKQKGVFRTVGGLLNNLSKFDFKEVSLRTRVLAGTEPDPFDTYDFLLSIHKKYKLDSIFFYPVR
ncbi:MAG: hypothetical protein R2750_09800 [Bacteroidales bacterium]